MTKENWTLDDAPALKWGCEKVRRSAHESLLGIMSGVTNAEAQAYQRLLDHPKFTFWPASTSKHHAWPGGLFQHTAEVVRLSSAIANEARQSRSRGAVWEINVGVVIMGALFHDLGKTDDYEPIINHEFKKTDHYRMVHHVVRSAELFQEITCDLDMSLDFRFAVKHCILAHHGRLEWGSPVEPATREAWAVHLGDMASVQCVERSKA